MKTFMIALKLTTVLTLLSLSNLNSTCQITPVQEDSVCITAEDARIIFKDLQLFEVCDSIRTNQKIQIHNLKNVFKKDQQQILLHTTMYAKKEKEFKRTLKKLQISRKLSMFGMPISIAAGFFIGILVVN